jgi:hypothetical protein
MIKNFEKFLNENILTDDKDVINALNLLVTSSTKDILDLRDSLKKLSTKNENLNENIITDAINKIKIKFKKSFDDRLWKYLINRKKSFYTELADKLNIFDLTSLDDVIKFYPGFKINTLYLAGGMDKSKDVGAGWRIIVENEFEKYPGKKTGLPEINLKEFGDVEPKRVVDGIYLDMLIDDPIKTKKLYDKPTILNPVRKEIDRTKNPDFAKAIAKYKTISHETEPEDFEPSFTDLRRTMSKTIEPDDEHLVRLADALLLGLNRAGAAGTYGELQTQSFMNKPIFVWMTDPEWFLGTSEKEPYGGFSFWSIPHFSKLARNTEEMKILVATIMNYI